MACDVVFEFARELAGDSVLHAPVPKALNTFEDHLPRICEDGNPCSPMLAWKGSMASFRLLARGPEGIGT